MIKGLQHKVARLRAMPAGEILYRAHTTVADKLLYTAHQLFADGQYNPQLKQTVLQKAWTGHWRHIALPSVELYSKKFPNEFENTRRLADEILQGKLDIFSTSVDLNPTHWHRDPLSGFTFALEWWSHINIYSKDIEIKYLWELNRHQHLTIVAKAFYLTHDEKYVSFIVEQLDSWRQANPCNYGVNWSSSLELAFRMISWTWMLLLIRESTKLDKPFFSTILTSIWQHALHIEKHLSKYSSANNHLIGEAVGLIYSGAFFPELPFARKWRTNGFSMMENELLRQSFTDGINKEQAVHYQKYIIDLAVLAGHALQPYGMNFSEPWKKRLAAMCRFIDVLLQENGYIPHIGDEDGGRALALNNAEHFSYHDSLNAAAAFLDRQYYRNNYRETACWLFPKKNVSTPEKSNDKNLTLFEHGGYAVIHSADQKLCFDFGELGLGTLAAHGHADALSVWLTVNGTPAFVDSNTFMYLGAGELRNYFRGTAAHNTVTLDDCDQSQILGPFQWGRKASGRLRRATETENSILVEAEHNGYETMGATHIRRIEWIKNSAKWEITDIIKSNNSHRFSLHFHTAADKIDIKEKTAYCEFNNFCLNLTFSADQDFELVTHQKEQSAFYQSPSFGQIQNGTIVQCRAKIDNTIKVTTIIQTNDKKTD